jgi:hypothetical protein
LALSLQARARLGGCRHGNPAATSSHHTPACPFIFSFIQPVHQIMVFFSGFALCAAISGAGALQIPLLPSTNQPPLGHPSGSKPLINSTELQDLISGDRLMTRANKLFEIAKLGEEEYNHPTRVIGSAGMLVARV